MRSFTGWLLLLAAGGCTWEPPLLDSPFGPPPLLNSVSGSLVFAGDGELGPTFITIYDVNAPPPPVGTGSPITFAGVPETAFEADLEIPSAPYGVSEVPDGVYLVSALMDVDGDFNPSNITLSGATCGDWLGSHVADLVTFAPQPVPLMGGMAATDVTVFLGQQLVTERPVFGFDPAASTIDLATLATGAPQTFTLEVAEINGSLFGLNPIELGPSCAPDIDDPGTFGWTTCLPPVNQTLDELCKTAILSEFVDANGDGQLDPYPDPALAQQGLGDVWPRVFIEYLPETPQFFTVDGVTYQERWLTQAFPLTVEIIGAGYQGLTPNDVMPVGIPQFADTLSVTVLPVFQHYSADGQAGVDPERGPFDVIDLSVDNTNPPPTGRWKATVITRTGQTWEVPNALAGDPDVPETFDPIQAGALTFQ